MGEPKKKPVKPFFGSLIERPSKMRPGQERRILIRHGIDADEAADIAKFKGWWKARTRDRPWRMSPSMWMWYVELSKLT